jgi:hypothetical protein
MKQLRLVLGAILMSVVTIAITAERSSPVPFSIEVDLSGSEAKMRCRAGCAWTTTLYSCGAGNSCSFVVDETGVEGISSPVGLK